MSLSFPSDPLVAKARNVLQTTGHKRAVIGRRERARASHVATRNDHSASTRNVRSGKKDHSGAAAAESNDPIRPLAKTEPQELLSKELRIPESRIRIQCQWNHVLLKAATEKGATRIAPATTLHPNDVPTADHHDGVEQKVS